MANKIELNEEIEKQAEWLKALAHPIRLCIVKGLAGKGSCNITYMKDCLTMPHSTLSQHVQVLKREGLIHGQQDGNHIEYSIADDRVFKILQLLELPGGQDE